MATSAASKTAKLTLSNSASSSPHAADKLTISHTIKRLYKSLLRAADTHDEYPSLKALITHPQLTNMNTTVYNNYPATYHYLNEYLGTGLRYYLPNKPMKSAIRQVFKQQILLHTQLNKSIHKTIDKSNIKSQLLLQQTNIVKLLDSAFYLLRFLNNNTKHNLSYIQTTNNINIDPAQLATQEHIENNEDNDSNNNNNNNTNTTADNSVNKLDWNMTPVLSELFMTEHNHIFRPYVSDKVNNNKPKERESFKEPRTTRSHIGRKSTTANNTNNLYSDTNNAAFHIAIDNLKLQPGQFLVAHPAMDDCFHHAVILITEHSERTGTTGVIINKPIETIIKDLKLKDDEEKIAEIFKKIYLNNYKSDKHSSSSSSSSKSKLLQRTSFPSGSIMYGGPVPGLVTLHRYAHLNNDNNHSRSVITNDNYPVFSANNDSFWSHLYELDVENEQKIRIYKANSNASNNNDTNTNTIETIDPINELQSEYDSLPETNDLLIYSGKCTWTAGQLRSELREGCWILMNGSGRHIFTQPNFITNNISKKNNIKPAAHTEQTPKTAATINPITAIDAIATPITTNPTTNIIAPTTTINKIPHPHSVALSLSKQAANPVDSQGFPVENIWSHAMFQLGGEYKHFAHALADDNNDIDNEEIAAFEDEADEDDDADDEDEVDVDVDDDEVEDDADVDDEDADDRR